MTHATRLCNFILVGHSSLRTVFGVSHPRGDVTADQGNLGFYQGTVALIVWMMKLRENGNDLRGSLKAVLYYDNPESNYLTKEDSHG
jgi:hypothetical protein